MPHYKDLNNQFHYLDSKEFEHLLPIGSVEITDEEYFASTTVVVPLAEVRETAKAALDQYAYKTRLRFISPNKDATYSAKLAQAKEYVTLHPTDLTNFGYIRAEVVRTGLGPLEAAQGLVMIGTAWLNLDAVIEETVLVAKEEISRKLKPETIQATLEAAKAKLDTLTLG